MVNFFVALLALIFFGVDVRGQASFRVLSRLNAVPVDRSRAVANVSALLYCDGRTQQLGNGTTLSFEPLPSDLFVGPPPMSVKLTVFGVYSRKSVAPTCTLNNAIAVTAASGSSPQLAVGRGDTLVLSNATVAAAKSTGLAVTYEMSRTCVDLNLLDCMFLFVRFQYGASASAAQPLDYAAISTELAVLKASSASASLLWNSLPIGSGTSAPLTANNEDDLPIGSSWSKSTMEWRTKDNGWSQVGPPFGSQLYGSPPFTEKYGVSQIVRSVVVPRCAAVRLKFMYIGVANIYWNGLLVFCSGERCMADTVAGIKLVSMAPSEISASGVDQRRFFVSKTIEISPLMMNTSSTTQWLAAAFVVPRVKADASGAIPVPFTMTFDVLSPTCTPALSPASLSVLSNSSQLWSSVSDVFAKENATGAVSANFLILAQVGTLTSYTQLANASLTAPFPWTRVIAPSAYTSVLLRTLLDVRRPDCEGFRVLLAHDGWAVLFVDGAPLFCGPDDMLTCSSRGVPSRVVPSAVAKTTSITMLNRAVSLATNASAFSPLLVALAIDGSRLDSLQFDLVFADALQQRRCSGTCADGVQNGLEAGIDCGGNCGTVCPMLVLPTMPPPSPTMSALRCENMTTCRACTDSACQWCFEAMMCEQGGSVSMCGTVLTRNNSEMCPFLAIGTSPESSSSPAGDNTVAVVLGVVIALLVVIAVVLVLVEVRRRRTAKKRADDMLAHEQNSRAPVVNQYSNINVLAPEMSSARVGGGGGEWASGRAEGPPRGYGEVPADSRLGSVYGMPQQQQQQQQFEYGVQHEQQHAPTKYATPTRDAYGAIEV